MILEFTAASQRPSGKTARYGVIDCFARAEGESEGCAFYRRRRRRRRGGSVRGNFRKVREISVGTRPEITTRTHVTRDITKSRDVCAYIIQGVLRFVRQPWCTGRTHQAGHKIPLPFREVTTHNFELLIKEE